MKTTPRQTLDQICKKQMKEWDIDKFKLSHTTLYDCIIQAIEQFSIKENHKDKFKEFLIWFKGQDNIVKNALDVTNTVKLYLNPNDLIDDKGYKYGDETLIKVPKKNGHVCIGCYLAKKPCGEFTVKHNVCKSYTVPQMYVFALKTEKL